MVSGCLSCSPSYFKLGSLSHLLKWFNLSLFCPVRRSLLLTLTGARDFMAWSGGRWNHFAKTCLQLIIAGYSTLIRAPAFCPKGTLTRSPHYSSVSTLTSFPAELSCVGWTSFLEDRKLLHCCGRSVICTMGICRSYADCAGTRRGFSFCYHAHYLHVVWLTEKCIRDVGIFLWTCVHFSMYV